MEIIVDSHSGGMSVVRPIGRLDLLTAIEVRQRVAEVIAAGNHRLIVDLAEVSVIDSTGLAALISALKAARLVGGDLRIARLNEQARQLFELTSLDRVLRPYPTVEEALAGY